ncbi:hypothetical protein CGGC5_v015339 [Colletotrichum fructicola Nara gc5]|uniref:Dynamin stalk domain-containing protein n=1 Tax=Colletotrichum fructicola (strain Nara gc5) TaxID=1213859 RepID=A0A7J6IHH1_COLFN|nr:hypothetical protein CGGC5_v015339 [Colletotrichum fructicola Nara gc5]
MMNLVESYMKKPNSIILAVVSAENELERSPEENEYLKIDRSREAARNLGLDWHVLCNRKDDEVLDPREFVEGELFESGLWSSVPASDRGVRALQVKLRRVLQDHIKNGVPMLLGDLQESLSDREVESSRLGDRTTTPRDMRAYLVNIAGRFPKLARDGIRGHYDDPFFGGFNGTHRKLRSQLWDLNRALRHILLTLGSAQLVMGRLNAGPLQYATPAYLEELLQAYNDEVTCPQTVAWPT